MDSLYSEANNGTISDTSISGADYLGIAILKTNPTDPTNQALLNVILAIPGVLKAVDVALSLFPFCTYI